MTDPFSAASGAVGIISLGIQVCQGLITYCSNFKAFDEDIANIRRKSEGLQDLLLALEGPLRRAEAGDGNVSAQVRGRVLDCEGGLRSLADAMQKYGSFPAPTNLEDKLRLLGKKTVYPFKKSTLRELTTTLESLQANIQLAVTCLTLETSQSHMDITVSSIEVGVTHARSMKESIDNLSANLDRLVLSSQLHQARLPVETALLQSLYDTQQQLHEDSIAVLHQRSPRNRKLIAQKRSSTKSCSCPRYPKATETRFTTYAVSAFWTRTTQHELACPYYKHSERVDIIGAKYTDCARVLGYSIAVAMSLTHGAGGLAISPQLKFRAVVSKDSPAFQLLDRGLAYGYRPDGNLLGKLCKLFQDGEASPTDVLPDGTTLLHAVLTRDYYFRQIGVTYEDTVRHNLVAYELVYGLIAAGANPLECDQYGRNILDLMFYVMLDSESDKLYNTHITIKLVQNLWDCGLVIRSNRLRDYESLKAYPSTTKQSLKHSLDHLPTWQQYDILDMPSVFQAIVLQNESMLEFVIATCPESANKTLPNGESTLHVSIPWLRGLEILLAAGANVCHLNREGFVALDYAKSPIHDEVIQLLLEVDSPINDRCIEKAAWSANASLQKCVVQHLVDRRQRLKDLARTKLSSLDLMALRLKPGGVLDAQAAVVTIALLKEAVFIAPQLKSGGTRFAQYHTVFHSPTMNPHFAEMLYQAGFHDVDEIDERGMSPFWQQIRYADYDFTSPKAVSMMVWLQRVGADMRKLHPVCGGSTMHAVGALYTRSLRALENNPDTIDPVLIDGQPHDFLHGILTDHYSDRCICACSKGGCRPITSALKFRCHSHHVNLETRDEGLLLLSICQRLEPFQQQHPWLISEIICTATFERLGLTHTCHMDPLGWARMRAPLLEEEIHEIQEEERPMIQQHKELVAEFEAKFVELGGTLVSFFEGYWEPRMEEVLRGNKEEAELERQRMREIGVLVDEDFETESDRSGEEMGECDDDDDNDDYDDDEQNDGHQEEA